LDMMDPDVALSAAASLPSTKQLHGSISEAIHELSQKDELKSLKNSIDNSKELLKLYAKVKHHVSAQLDRYDAETSQLKETVDGELVDAPTDANADYDTQTKSIASAVNQILGLKPASDDIGSLSSMINAANDLYANDAYTQDLTHTNNFNPKITLVAFNPQPASSDAGDAEDADASTDVDADGDDAGNSVGENFDFNIGTVAGDREFSSLPTLSSVSQTDTVSEPVQESSDAGTSVDVPIQYTNPKADPNANLVTPLSTESATQSTQTSYTSSSPRITFTNDQSGSAISAAGNKLVKPIIMS